MLNGSRAPHHTNCSYLTFNKVKPSQGIIEESVKCFYELIWKLSGSFQWRRTEEGQSQDSGLGNVFLWMQCKATEMILWFLNAQSPSLYAHFLLESVLLVECCLTLDVVGKRRLPAVHLNELHAAQDLVHQLDAPVRNHHTPFTEIRSQAWGQHLQERIHMWRAICTDRHTATVCPDSKEVTRVNLLVYGPRQACSSKV